MGWGHSGWVGDTQDFRHSWTLCFRMTQFLDTLLPRDDLLAPESSAGEFLSVRNPFTIPPRAAPSLSGRLRGMAYDSKTLEGEQSAATGAGMAHMVALMEAELERLQANLELIRASDAPNRRALIRQHVTRIDERYNALQDLLALRDAAQTQD